MLMPLDTATLPRKATALRGLLLQREAEHAAVLELQAAELHQQAAELERQAAELQAARNGLQEQVLRNEQLELLLGDLEEQIAETAPAEPEQPAPSAPTATTRRKPARRPLPENLPRDVVEHAAPCACPKCGGTLRALGEDVTEVLDYVPGSFRVIRHVRPKPVVPELREHRAGAGSQPAHRARPCRAWSALAWASGEILRPSAAVSPGRDLRAERPRPGPLDSG